MRSSKTYAKYGTQLERDTSTNRQVREDCGKTLCGQSKPCLQKGVYARYYYIHTYQFLHTKMIFLSIPLPRPIPIHSRPRKRITPPLPTHPILPIPFYPFRQLHSPKIRQTRRHAHASAQETVHNSTQMHMPAQPMFSRRTRRQCRRTIPMHTQLQRQGVANNDSR